MFYSCYQQLKHFTLNSKMSAVNKFAAYPCSIKFVHRILGTIEIEDDKIVFTTTVNKIDFKTKNPTDESFHPYETARVFSSLNHYIEKHTFKPLGTSIATFFGLLDLNDSDTTALFLYFVVFVNSQQFIGTPLCKGKILERLTAIKNFGGNFVINDESFDCMRVFARDFLNLVGTPESVPKSVPESKPRKPCKCGSTETFTDGKHKHNFAKLRELGLCTYCFKSKGEGHTCAKSAAAASARKPAPASNIEGSPKKEVIGE